MMGKAGVVIRWWVLAVSGMLGVQVAASAQTFPSKPIRWIVATPPGGGADILSRALGQKLAERWGVPVVVENRGGAGGIIGMEATARAAPDGYTMLMGTTNFTVNAAIREKLPYDTLKDFTPITLVAVQPFLFLIHPALPAKSMREFIALAKARPGQISYASTGTGGGQHMSMELLKTMTGIDVVHVPYKGSAQGTTDLISGEVQATLASVLTAGEYVKAGRVRALAVTTSKRSQLFPNLPTIAEAGVPGFEFTAWFGVLTPAGVPPAIATSLHDNLIKVLALPEIKQQIAAQGADIVGSSQEEFAQRIRTEIPKWKKLIADAKIKPE
jgi:tripartite-type tricarboxylate transporter receptor subunit TctC